MTYSEFNDIYPHSNQELSESYIGIRYRGILKKAESGPRAHIHEENPASLLRSLRPCILMFDYCRIRNLHRKTTQLYSRRNFSNYSTLYRRVYVLGEGLGQWRGTTFSNNGMTTELRAQSEGQDSTSKKDGSSTFSASWICVDRGFLNLRHQWSGGSREEHRQGTVGLTFKETDGDSDGFEPLVSSLPNTSQVQSLLNLSASEGKRQELTLLVPAKPTPPGPEDCCMSGCAHCVHDIYMEELQAYKCAMRNVKQKVQELGSPYSSATKQNEDLEDDMDDDMDPATKAFMKLERKLKDKSAKSTNTI
ncbi:uncharacterized protein MELLADRAFT_66303 [Melampsora larici-populina 98AG31]|uniref:Oxidoreductase-like domain-containing protein n=1 Tax=Melampsora larici-populina (strain 98AG31 / pathotype 3-4-7) TaxID=747676 RepID=F4RYN1_MELLP|nr:uncharacterized protein MELLADRAFT_66303 [Melampsora larici-populina 98AG31]EGG02547.1 hypothetical protein MELLADRAFT_66303 [Melampsora larici-populina 98AG31]